LESFSDPAETARRDRARAEQNERSARIAKMIGFGSHSRVGDRRFVGGELRGGRTPSHALTAGGSPWPSRAVEAPPSASITVLPKMGSQIHQSAALQTSPLS